LLLTYINWSLANEASDGWWVTRSFLSLDFSSN
jgi:hypothetical protein